VNILISGGCKNGKSYYAQQLAVRQAEDGAPLYYIATMDPADEEDHARILRHRREREGWGFTTLEQSSGMDSSRLIFQEVFSWTALPLFFPTKCSGGTVRWTEWRIGGLPGIW
jgi:hypothetical protein